MQNARRTSVEVNPTTTLIVRLRSRVGHLALFWFVIWPALAVVLGAIAFRDSSMTRNVPFWVALPGVAAGVLYLAPEFLISALILFVLSSAVFAAFPGREARRIRFIEPAIAFIGMSLGVALEAPAVLNNPVFAAVRQTTLLCAYLVLAALVAVLALFRGAAPQRRLMLVRAVAPGVLFVLFGWLIAQLPISTLSRTANGKATVILGIDSLGTRMDIKTLRKFSEQHNGTFYENAITPGLLTNAVWTAILEHRPIHDTGVLLTFQSPDWTRSPYQMISEAKRRGYQTWSFFPGQNTSYVGSTAGFDHDRSGPMGWAQYATAAAKNGALLLPFVVSRLPHLPFAKVPSNQSGTYAYDLRTDVHNILSARQGDKPVFTIAHLEYLHDETYPRFAELPRIYRSVLLSSSVSSLRDFSGDWQSPTAPGDNIGLYAWKIENVQAVITDELQNSGFLDEANRNRLVLLSDHGLRWRLSNEGFGNGGYYQVPLITFGVPVRDIQQPISLLDISGLIGLDDHTSPGPAAPVVEYVNLPTIEAFRAAVLGASWNLDGRIDVAPDMARQYLGMLKTYDPSKPGRYEASIRPAVHKNDPVPAANPER